MGFFDRLLGREPQGNGHQPGFPQPRPPRPGQPQGPWQQPGGPVAPHADDQAIARYQYLLRTAPPERLEQVHAEAFSRLTPQQRGEVLRRLSHDLPPGEAPRTDDPQTLARAATRAEMTRPGYLGHAFGGMGMGMGGMFATSMLGSIAGSVIGSAIAHQMMGGFDSSPEAAGLGGLDGAPADGVGADGSFVDGGPFAAGDQGGDLGWADQGLDQGGAMDDASGFLGGDGGFDLGGGDFGGGDFGDF